MPANDCSHDSGGSAHAGSSGSEPTIRQPSHVNVGDQFDVTIQVDSPTQQIIALEAFLNF